MPNVKYLLGWLFLFKLNALARPKSASFRTPLFVVGYGPCGSSMDGAGAASYRNG
jgi:hypothetical protein